MKKFVSLFLLLFGAVCLFGQTVNFRIEIDAVNAGGMILKPDTPGSTVLSATAASSDLSALSFTVSDANIFISELQALATNDIFDDPWVEVPQAAGPIAATYDWNLQRQNLTVGNSPVLLILTAPLESLAPGDYVGLVSSSFLVDNLGAITVGFETTTPWNNFILGSSGSINLVQIPVPEPSHYALFFGVLGLGFVLWRRRK